jgi:hypothetical protein
MVPATMGSRGENNLPRVFEKQRGALWDCSFVFFISRNETNNESMGAEKK